MNVPAIGIGPLGPSEWSVGGLGTSIPDASDEPSGGQSFGDALAGAIGSLETSQANATQAAGELATGTLTDPTQAVTAVENASLAMDFAAQVRNQLTTDATTLFQTQV